MKKAIATIEGANGTMTIYYNGKGEAMTAEDANTCEMLEVMPRSLKEARKDVSMIYGDVKTWKTHNIW